nr:MAG TPA: protein of unknown function (DUF4083) [Bacteriophage sp.]
MALNEILLSILVVISLAMMMYFFCKEMKTLNDIDNERKERLDNIIKERENFDNALEHLENVNRYDFPDYYNVLTVMSKAGTEDAKYLLLTPEGVAVLGEQLGKKVYEDFVNKKQEEEEDI